jgi:uncharacterized surface anchored protein
MKKLITLIAGIFLSITLFSQSVKISGAVNDPNESKPVKNAVIALLTPKDSILYKFTRTDAAGNFTLKDIKPGKYILMTTHPYTPTLLICWIMLK